jgi:catechol 2,3-dioxygenase-like lactoylglutathione lyase family enzyme
MSVFERAAPIVPVRDLDAALDRYRRLGFAARRYDGPQRYGFVDRGQVSLHLHEAPGHDPAATSSMVYLFVDDADAVHTEWAAAAAGGRFDAPRDTGWGMREFAYVDPDGTLHRVGSEIPHA